MAKLNVPTTVGRWKLEAKLGEGAFGNVYLVSTALKGTSKRGFAAMKVEERKKYRDEELLRMEVWVLLKLINIPSFCTVYGRGQTEEFTYLVMTLLCKSLEDLRQLEPSRRFSMLTTLRIGVQLMNAYQALHSVGFIHRDVKPDNMAPGNKRKDIIYLYDFGLARQIYTDETKTKLRPRRRKVPFRGTYRYCSVNAHKCGDQGRVDDIWSLLYCLIEFCKRRLPWAGVRPNESVVFKETAQDVVLFQDCPPSFCKIKKQLTTLGFEDVPDYGSYALWMTQDMQTCPGNVNAEFEWQKPQKHKHEHHHRKKREEDADTETVQTADSEYSSRQDNKDEDEPSEEVDNTLDDLPPDDQYMSKKQETKKK